MKVITNKEMCELMFDLFSSMKQKGINYQYYVVRIMITAMCFFCATFLVNLVLIPYCFLGGAFL